jgi:hypothetical protein
MVTVTDCAPSIETHGTGYLRLSELAHSESQPETYGGMPSRTLLKILPRWSAKPNVTCL